VWMFGQQHSVSCCDRRLHCKSKSRTSDLHTNLPLLCTYQLPSPSSIFILQSAYNQLHHHLAAAVFCYNSLNDIISSGTNASWIAAALPKPQTQLPRIISNVSLLLQREEGKQTENMPPSHASSHAKSLSQAMIPMSVVPLIRLAWVTYRPLTTILI
jgi:hypothetical protein